MITNVLPYVMKGDDNEKSRNDDGDIILSNEPKG